MKRSIRLFATCTVLSALSAGCQSEPTTLREEAEQARENLSETREEAAEIVDEAQEDAVDNLADARQDASENIDEAKRDAEQMVEEAETELDQKLNQLGDQTLPLEEETPKQPDEVPTVSDIEETP